MNSARLSFSSATKPTRPDSVHVTKTQPREENVRKKKIFATELANTFPGSPQVRVSLERAQETMISFAFEGWPEFRAERPAEYGKRQITSCSRRDKMYGSQGGKRHKRGRNEAHLTGVTRESAPGRRVEAPWSCWWSSVRGHKGSIIHFSRTTRAFGKYSLVDHSGLAACQKLLQKKGGACERWPPEFTTPRVPKKLIWGAADTSVLAPRAEKENCAPFFTWPSSRFRNTNSDMPPAPVCIWLASTRAEALSCFATNTTPPKFCRFCNIIALSVPATAALAPTKMGLQCRSVSRAALWWTRRSTRWTCEARTTVHAVLRIIAPR